jgi:hypothetical protein
MDLLATQVEHALSGDELQADFGVPRFQAAELRDQPGGGERAGNGNRNPRNFSRSPHLLRRPANLRECRIDSLEIVLPGRGEFDGIAGALKERHAEVGLKPLYLMAYGRF